MKFRVFYGAHEFIGSCKVQYNPGKLTGPWENSEPCDMEIEIEDIYMKNGCRERHVYFEDMNDRAKERIIEEIAEDYITESKRWNEDRYDR
jgi:hypothetical protein